MEKKWDLGDVEKAIMVAWALWTNRNEVRHGGKLKDDNALVYGAMDYLLEYQNCVDSPVLPATNMPALWSPPPPMSYKINVDGAVFGAQKSVGVGVVIRDDEGRVMGACYKKLRAPMGAMEAEAKAFEVGIQFAKDMLIHDFILEGDSLILVNALNETSPPPSAVAAIVLSSLSAFKDFRRVDVSHVKRSGNWPAHLLAKYAIGISDFAVCVEESPSFIDQALLQDVTLASSIL
ncbi:uncharacterized protein LOC142629445 [Castanea sativa]|uniref:uncharacterized protein LOC142629445 n=1 Tax=Castanea sativa TaxID=21020 RepID=UPI003F649AD8